MADDQKTQMRLEIAHVLFIDIVGYSKLLIDEQSEALQELNGIVRNTEAAKTADLAGQLIFLPTGDGMALVFTGSVEDPVECALQISQKLRAQPSLPIRMGIHSGPVHHVSDVNQRDNIAGAGINIAQRVMDCGDAGHILASKRVADDLSQYRRWQPYLHELGDFEVKHGVIVSVVNLYADVVGNPKSPERLKGRKRISQRAKSADEPRRSLMPLVIGGLMLFTLLALALVFTPAILKQMRTDKTQVAPSATPSTPPAASTAGGRAKSIAVLPFENMSRDPDNAFFTDGVQDQILTNLAKIADLKVISRTSVMQYKTGAARNLREIAQQLGVTHVVEGSVQRAGNQVRVTAQLINAQTDAHEWADSYDRKIDDVFAIQSDIAKAVADQLQAKLSPNEKTAIEKAPTKDVVAFDLYSRAKSLFIATSFSALAGSNLRQAVDLLNQAIARDPSFFLAHSQLAIVHANLYFLGIDHTPGRLAAAEAAAAAAISLQPDAGEAHLAKAELLYRCHLDYDGALKELEIASRTLPNDSRLPELRGYIARRQNKHGDGVRYLQRAIELDPRNFFTLQQIALSYLSLRRYSEEAAVLDRALAIKPDDIDTRVVRALIALDQYADPKPLRDTIDHIRAADPEGIKSVADTWLVCALAERDVAAAEAALQALGNNPAGVDALRIPPHVNAGLLARMTKNEAKAREAFAAARTEQEKDVQEQPNYGPALCVLGLIDAGLGRKEEALKEGRRAMELLPVAKDSINGAHMMEYFAIIAAWVGEKDLACAKLAEVTKLESNSVTYGYLKLQPWWDPLRGYPPFEKIVESLAPKS